ncbi:hypothetical protein COW64_08430 [bacterium (Candidatus Blackallbacteria) CG18_big_fil_WC_8_21_14_2_50_49_26]|nr:MAG: hypothetical protein COW64_08430 [bacterium (Candidatus Blackallbacteria) CG18_big_fil_WC_8_21_14_2_50_49_26]
MSDLQKAEKRVKKRRLKRKTHLVTLRRKYALAKSLGLPASLAQVVSSWHEARIKTAAKEYRDKMAKEFGGSGNVWPDVSASGRPPRFSSRREAMAYLQAIKTEFPDVDVSSEA